MFLGMLRILRCNGLFSGGVDRVPLGRSWRRLLRRVGQDYRRFWSP
jgi:putative component of membrane protein insertase Oxa1/YidC/SpoIIIJ protein YidD